MSKHSDLSPGAQELVSRFKETYRQLTAAQRENRGEEMFIDGHYALSAAESAYWAIAREHGWPNMRWSLKGVTFVLNSSIPCTVGVYHPPDESTLLFNGYFGIALAIAEPLAIGAAFLLVGMLPPANLTFFAIECCAAAPMLFALLLALAAAAGISQTIVRTRFKR